MLGFQSSVTGVTGSHVFGDNLLTKSTLCDVFWAWLTLKVSCTYTCLLHFTRNCMKWPYCCFIMCRHYPPFKNRWWYKASWTTVGLSASPIILMCTDQCYCACLWCRFSTVKQKELSSLSSPPLPPYSCPPFFSVYLSPLAVLRRHG